jgi:phage-related protein
MTGKIRKKKKEIKMKITTHIIKQLIKIKKVIQINLKNLIKLMYEYKKHIIAFIDTFHDFKEEFKETIIDNILKPILSYIKHIKIHIQ